MRLPTPPPKKKTAAAININPHRDVGRWLARPQRRAHAVRARAGGAPHDGRRLGKGADEEAVQVALLCDANAVRGHVA